MKTEAAAAADRDRLIPVLIEDVPIRFEFKRIQTAMLPGWRGDREHPEFSPLVESIRHLLGQPAAPGCGEPGAHTLKKAGTYTLTVGALRVPAVGAYRMQVFNVPAPARFPIRIGDTIKENSPGPGAGEIETPGAHDVYTFTAAAGQQVFFRMIEHGKGMEQIKWKLTDSDGTAIFDTCLGCGQPGVQILKKGGPYTMSVGADRVGATGPYRLQLSAVPGG